MKRHVLVCVIVAVVIFAFSGHGETCDYRTQDMVNILLGLMPEDNCVYGHYAYRKMIVASVVKGRGVVCECAKDPNLKKVFIETHRAYADLDTLSMGVYRYLGITQYEDVFGVKRTVRSFRELEGDEAKKYHSLILLAREKSEAEEKKREADEKKREEKAEEEKFAGEQSARKRFYKSHIDSQSLVVSNLVTVAPRIKRFIKSAQIDNDLWRSIRAALQNDDWLPVLRLCPSNGFRDSKAYEIYPEENELQKCAEFLLKMEVPLVFIWKDKVPRFEVVEYDLSSGVLKSLKPEDIMKGYTKTGCKIDVQIGKRYFVCPIGGQLRLQKCMQKRISKAEREMNNASLRGAVCEEQYMVAFKEFFLFARQYVLQNEFFVGDKKK